MTPSDSAVNTGPLRDRLAGVQVGDRLFNRLLKYDVRQDGTLTPEGAVRIGWVVRLIKEYGFSVAQLDIEVAAGRIGRAAERGSDTVFADVVAYRDAERSEPFVVVETKAPDEKKGVKQAESYARNLGAEYHVWHNGRDPVRCFRTSRFADKSQPTANIPRWVGSEPVASRISKKVSLPPFRDEPDMRGVVHQCHELILEKQGHDPAKAFDELTKLLFLKLYDEREVPKVYEFMVLAGEEPADVGERLRDLFSEAIRASRYKDVFSSKFTKKASVALELDDFTITQIVKLLQGYSLINTTENITGADIKGTVFEQMVGSTFRGELAQYFTPREIVQFIVEMLPPRKEHQVHDPACGSGGFLIMVLRHMKDLLAQEHPNLSAAEIAGQVRYFAENKLFGTDINERMARVAKMNMIMHGDGHGGIAHTNGLLTDPDTPQWCKTELGEAQTDLIYSNPPFAGREKDTDVLERFDLGKNARGDTRSVSKEVLFIEFILKRLKPGGKAGLVLPAGIFNNPSMKDVRNHIRRRAKIVALVGLPHLAFQVAGANNEGHLIFLEKVDHVPDDYNIFIDWAVNVGIDAVGRKTAKNDLPDIVRRFRNPPAECIMKFSDLEDRIDPWYYHPNYERMTKRLSRPGMQWLPISRIFIRSRDRFRRADHGRKVLRYIEKEDVDVEAGRILSWKEHTADSIPSRATYVVKEGDILIPDAYDCMRGLAIVGAEHEGCIATNRFFVVRANPETIVQNYVRHHFTKPEILALVKRHCSGEINPGIGWPAFSKILIPLPTLDQQGSILAEIQAIETKRRALQDRLAALDESIARCVRQALPGAIGNYEDIKMKRAEFIGEVLWTGNRPSR